MKTIKKSTTSYFDKCKEDAFSTKAIEKELSNPSLSGTITC